VFDGDESVGEVTRGAESPLLEAPVALALVESNWTQTPCPSGSRARRCRPTS
jgi:aminomethyltransferase